MPFNNDTNRKRVSKMLEILDLIEASALSNKASLDEITTILDPLLQRIEGAPATRPARADVSQAAPESRVEDKLATLPHRRGLASPPWQDMRDMAQTAPLKDLLIAMTVCLDRLDRELHA